MTLEKAISVITLLTLSLSMTACSTLFQNKEKNHNAMCSELKHQIIFNGSTGNPSDAFRERSDDPKLNQSYTEEKCE